MLAEPLHELQYETRGAHDPLKDGDQDHIHRPPLDNFEQLTESRPILGQSRPLMPGSTYSRTTCQPCRRAQACSFNSLDGGTIALGLRVGRHTQVQ